MYPDRSVTYVPGSYQLPSNHRMKLPGLGQQISRKLASTSLALQLMRGR